MSNQTLTDPLTLYGKTFNSRFLLGTALYESPEIMLDSVATSQTEILTLGLRRQNPAQGDGERFWQMIQSTGCTLLPNTAGCKSAKEAINLALMSRELFATNWVKLEVIGDDYNLQPDPFQLLEAAQELIAQDFCVLPYCTDDLILCQRLREAGCQVLMPWGAPIGTGRGLLNRYALKALRQRFDCPLIIDAGLGAPSQACDAMELGFDGVLLNTAVAKAQDPALMAASFRSAISAGRDAYRAGLMQKRQTAHPSTPTIGQPFWHQNS
ncbi:thiazole synthase [Gilvimarinus agarilyticus]|uniref:thiazole synthase n=1 Tax=unclassified Gilvimarinus TaxID=2642066 RepID=UPI001C09CB94|nr:MULTISPECIES: thiazole synthase [unclassified Gilvimarinus]MBU2887298.1 thiazole synthase [Gilvimarinus agarilyticus]MDO6571957.1 thiazole synthase [Gilvimarinus sp. 2_MG-2023]MDO6746025.1 thiazole synthase [Gilvimarinus sp. 1_MG-2023]